MKIDFNTYFNDCFHLINILRNKKFDCIISLKRSGFILGSIVSNQLDIPLFVPSEIGSIPNGFKECLVIDDKICTGKSIRKIINQLNALNKNHTTCCLYVEKYIKTDIWIKETGKTCTMWYEKDKRNIKSILLIINHL